VSEAWFFSGLVDWVRPGFGQVQRPRLYLSLLRQSSFPGELLRFSWEAHNHGL
jgi:hypothetical protein